MSALETHVPTPRTDALADRHGDIDPDSPYWDALNLATELEKEIAELRVDAFEVRKACGFDMFDDEGNRL